MIHNVHAIFDHGILRPVEPLSLPEGARVHLRVEEQAETQSPPTNASLYKEWLDRIAGQWQGEFIRDAEGNFEFREPMS